MVALLILSHKEILKCSAHHRFFLLNTSFYLLDTNAISFQYEKDSFCLGG